MSKANRLIELMITINAKRHFTIKELADEFSVSKRTIMRDLQALEQAGFPLYSQVGAAGGYHVLEERLLPPIAFTESEAKAIFFACQSLQYYRDLPFQEETGSAQQKFLNFLSPDMQHSIMQMKKRVVFYTPDRHCDAPLLKELFAAIVAENKAVTIRYSSIRSDSVRTIVPIGIYAVDGLWYCPAFCLVSNEMRIFRVDRILEILKVEDSTVKKSLLPKSIQDFIDRPQPNADYHLLVELTSIGVKRCESDPDLAKGLQVLPSGEGKIDMDITHPVMEWTAEYFLPLGKNVTILEPPELLNLMKERTAELYHYYRDK